MILKVFLTLFLTSLLVLPFTAFGQSSSFGTLVDEKNANRSIITTEGQTLQSYEKSLAEYEKLLLAYTKSYGPQRITLEAQVLAKGKDSVVAKFGATQNFLTNLQTKLNELNLLSPEDQNIYQAGIESYTKFMDKGLSDLSKVDSLDVLKIYSTNVNKAMFDELLFSEVYLAEISIVRARYVIERIMELAPIIQAQINTSADVGGNVGAIQASMDAAMLTLEEVKTSYFNIETELNATRGGKSYDFNLMNLTRANNAKVDKAYKDIVKVVVDLKTLYLQAPWDERLVEQLLMPKSTETTLENNSNNQGGN